MILNEMRFFSDGFFLNAYYADIEQVRGAIYCHDDVVSHFGARLWIFSHPKTQYINPVLGQERAEQSVFGISRPNSVVASEFFVQVLSHQAT